MNLFLYCCGLLLQKLLSRTNARDGQQLAFAHFDTRAAPTQRLQAMSNAKDSCIDEFLFENLLKMSFGLFVEGRGSFVEKEHGRFLENHASKTHLRADLDACKLEHGS